MGFLPVMMVCLYRCFQKRVVSSAQVGFHDRVANLKNRHASACPARARNLMVALYGCLAVRHAQNVKPKSTGIELGAACLLVFRSLAGPTKGQPRENRGVAPSVAPSRMFCWFSCWLPQRLPGG